MQLDVLARKATKAAVLPLAVPGRRPSDVVILLYHRVGMGDREVDVPAAAFERQMGWLGQRQRPLAIGEAFGPEFDAGLGGGVVVTVDDGYRDFVDHALPALVRHRVPAVLYLTTGLVADGHTGRSGDRLSWAALRDALATGLVTVGAHTHTHPRLSRATVELATREMRQSKELVEDRLGVECRHFAYPYSVASPGSERVARALFATAALAWGRNRPGRCDLYRLGRVPVLRSDGSLFFRAKVGGLLDFEWLPYRILGRGPWRDS